MEKEGGLMAESDVEKCQSQLSPSQSNFWSCADIFTPPHDKYIISESLISSVRQSKEHKTLPGLC